MIADSKILLKNAKTIEKIKMGMNYYIKSDPCKCCGLVKTEIHIGKQSSGWKFLFNGDEDRGLETYKEWKDLILNDYFKVYDESNNLICKQTFINSIETVQKSNKKNVEETYDKRFYIDEDGYNFCKTGFS